ncbi:MAG: hypothetical protein IAF38_05840, partial [Bacteroidia bacterium]|nr:hypothetical protein [Bacteroidia bacterium]
MSVARKINSLKKKVSWQATDLLFATGFKNSLLRNKPGLRILVYHGIDKAGRTDINGRFISAKRFEQHLISYKENFNMVSLNDAYSENYDKDKFNLCITFDDGY